MPRSSSSDAHRLDEAQAAAAVADGGGDLLRDVEAIGGEVDVVGDERHARADDRGAAARVRRRRTEVRRPRRLCHLRRQPFELAAPDVFEVAPRGSRCRLFVEEHRQSEPCGDRLAPSLVPAPRSRPSSRPRSARTARRRPRRGADARPWCARRSIAARLRSNSVSTARFEGGCVAGQRDHRAVVRRRSDDKSSRRTPGVAATASTIARTTSGRRPSLMFGTHSMIAMATL